MTYHEIINLVSLIFFIYYVFSASFAKNFWIRIEKLLWANIFLVSLSAQQVVEQLQ